MSALPALCANFPLQSKKTQAKEGSWISSSASSDKVWSSHFFVFGQFDKVELHKLQVSSSVIQCHRTHCHSCHWCHWFCWGLWTAHAGWFFEKERVLSKMPEAIVASHNNETEDSSAETWNLIPWFYKESPEFYDWLRQPYYCHQIGKVLAVFWLGLVAGIGWSFVVWGFVIRLLLGIHGVSAVNSFAHVWGEKPFKTGWACCVDPTDHKLFEWNGSVATGPQQFLAMIGETDGFGVA